MAAFCVAATGAFLRLCDIWAICKTFRAGRGAARRRSGTGAASDYRGAGRAALGAGREPSQRLVSRRDRGSRNNVRALLALPADYHVLFLQGGGSLQFGMIPLNLLPDETARADYLCTGYWSAKSIGEARAAAALRWPHRAEALRVAWSGEAENYRCLPDNAALHWNESAAFAHYISNETVEGLQFHETMGAPGVRRVCDMSSDFLSRPFAAREYSLIYAHAQKNLGPAGVTIVVLADEAMQRIPDGLPPMLDYRCHANAHSIYNTPPVFAIYVVLLVTRWLRDEIGGLEKMGEIKRRQGAPILQFA